MCIIVSRYVKNWYQSPDYPYCGLWDVNDEKIIMILTKKKKTNVQEAHTTICFMIRPG